MRAIMNMVIAGYSDFSWELALQLKDQIRGRLYFVLSEQETARRASLNEPIIAVHGEITDTEILDQLNLSTCDTFVAGSGEDGHNVLAALYAKKQGVPHVYARIFDVKLCALLRSLEITPVQTARIAASAMAIGILKPAVDELVSLTRGNFDLVEIPVADFPELAGCHLGDLQGEHFHVIAVAENGDISLSGSAVIDKDAVLILIYNNQIKKQVPQRLRRLAARCK